jgi:hypothetical protein
MDGHPEQQSTPNSVTLPFRRQHGRIIGRDSERATSGLSMQRRHLLVIKGNVNREQSPLQASM